VAIAKEMAERQPPGFQLSGQARRGHVSFQIGKPVVPAKADELYGWRYTSTDGSRIVQFRTDGVTYSTLRGYTTWVNAKEEAQALWRQYCERWGPGEVARLAVRYINLLEVPPGADFDLYLTAGPRVPPGAPEALSSFLHRVTIPFSADATTSAVVTQALERKPDASAAIVLDIDVSRVCRHKVDSPEIWGILDDLQESPIFRFCD